jgi:uncharacterized protein (TIGR03086 family)
MLIDLHRLAVLTSIDVVSQVRPDDLARPTPCSEWTLADLLAHMTVQHNGFAAAARGHGSNLEAWQARPLGPDPVADYRAAALGVLEAFSEPGVLDRTFTLPEFRPVSTFPGSLAVGFHLIDYVVHAWDVARSIEIPYTLDPRLADPALKIALAVPNGPNRLEPTAPFHPALPPNTTTPLNQILTTLGRSPTWPH